MNYKKFILLIFLISFVSSFKIHAEPTPRWLKKGVKELNKKRSNDSYNFHIFQQYEADRPRFEVDLFKPLLDYIDSTYHVSKTEMTVDSIPAAGVLPKTYMISFNHEGKENTVYARLVDQYQKYEDFPDGSYEYNTYQLFAISNPRYSVPDFDQFSLTRNYGVKPVLMSIIPGLGQIYKGQPAKGYSFLGVEAAMVASIIFATNRVHHWVNYSHKYPQFYDNYQSKATTFRQWRMFCFIAGGGLYIYNLFDAAFSKGARYVEVKRNNAPNAQFSFVPIFSPDILGVGININL